MIKITRQQMEHLRETNAGGFEARMVRRLGERFPLRCAAMGPESVIRVVRKGLGSAALHGVSAEKDVCRLIELMCASGEGIAAAPDHEWITEALERATPANLPARLEQLGELASERLSGGSDADPADPLRREAAQALARPRAGAPDRRFDGRAAAGAPVMPCPNAPGGKRLCSFSS